MKCFNYFWKDSHRLYLQPIPLNKNKLLKKPMVKALLVAPKNPTSFWTFDRALEIKGKKVLFQPAGLLTVAGMLPDYYDIKVVDTNITPLKDEDIEEADIVLTSSMIIHWSPLEEIIERANALETPVLAGGPLPTQYHEEIKGNATFFLGEAEAGFLDVLEEIVAEGYKPESRVVDRRRQFIPLGETPLQRFDLIQDSFNEYYMMAIQFTRGCPEHCTFCNIPALYGNETRLKERERVMQEFDLLYKLGWRGGIMPVDDNLVGNQEAIIPILKSIEKWQRRHHHQYNLFTQASLRMYENPDLMEAMYQAGFTDVFIGLESPSPESLKFMGAQKNLQSMGRSMLEKVRDIQSRYFKVSAGFILGFDTDPDDIADLMKKFIQDAGICVAMVGPLGVLPDTPDYKRYSKQGRLVKGVRYAGGSGIFTRELSYVPHDREGNEIDPNTILDRHREVVEHINDPENYFQRAFDYLLNRERRPLPKIPADFSQVKALFRSIYQQGIRPGYRRKYWKYLWGVARNSPRDLGEAVHYAVQGHHLIRTTQEALRADDYIPHTGSLYERFAAKARDIYEGGGKGLHKRLKGISATAQRIVNSAERKYRKLHPEFRMGGAYNALEKLRCRVDAVVETYRISLFEPTH